MQALIDDEGEVILPERQIDYDQLVIAVGSISNDFGTPGISEHCIFLDSANQAVRFQKKLMNNFI